MGRKSREKCERRENGSGPIALAAKGTDLPDLVALLEAASVSPTASHKIPSLGLIFESVMKRTRTGKRPASPELLPRLISEAHNEDPYLCMQEDWMPYDVRAKVMVRWCGGLFRIAPGSLERPVATVDFLGLLSSVIDPVLIEQNGYGLRDVVEIVLRRVDHVASTLAPTWADEALEDTGEPASLRMEELSAARTLQPISETIDVCSSPERASVALQKHLVPANQLVRQRDNPATTFGPIIGVLDRDGKQIVLPAGLLMDELDALGADLARQALEIDPRVENRWAGAVASRVGHALMGSGHGSVGPVQTPQGDMIHSVTTYSRQQILVIDTVTSIEQTSLPDILDLSNGRLGSIEAGVDLQGPQHSIHIPPDAEIVKLQVVAAPRSGMSMLNQEYRIATLEDLLWIARTCAREPVDLWHFVNDLTDPRGIAQTLMWDLIDAWEVWRDNAKSFYRGGSQLDIMMFAPHAAESEWQAAAIASTCEEALLALGLPALPAWPIIDDLTEIRYIGDLTGDQVFRMLPWQTPVAVSASDPTTSENADTIWNLAEGITWKLERSQDAFIHAAKSSGISALRIHFKLGNSDENDGLLLWPENRNELSVTIGWDESLLDSLKEDSYAVESLIGRLIAGQFSEGQHREAFVAAWDAAPPGIRVDGVSVQQRAHDLPEPIEPHDSHRSAAQQRLGEHLLASGVEPGNYVGSSATQLESQHVYPWLLEELHRIVGQYDSNSLLELALVELERANYKRWAYNQQIAWQRGFPVHSGTEDDWGQEIVEHATRVRSISLILEEILSNPPTGVVQPDKAIWQEALSIGDLCLESAFRSETVHLSLTSTAVVVSDSFEVEVELSDDPTDVDLHAYSKRRRSSAIPDGIPIDTSLLEESEPESQDPTPLLEVMPELEDIDSAFKRTLGFGLAALLNILGVARQWSATSESPVSKAAPPEIVEEAVTLGVGATEDEYRQALEWLTLRGSDLRADPREYWESERRAVRIATRPFVECDAQVQLLPWSVELTLEILATYLGDGRLPWPGRILPHEVNQALNRYRQRRNRQLELDCVAALSSEGLVTRGNIRPEKAKNYGISNLSGEIDVLCVDPQRSRIWVIEAKDPYTPFSPRQVRRLITDFHEESGYVDKLFKKVEEVQNCATALAQALSVERPSGIWQVVGLMVTRRPTPAAFAVEARVPFCVFEDLTQVVQLDDLPSSGFVELQDESNQ